MADNNTDVCLIGKKLFHGVDVSHSSDEQGSVPFMAAWSGGDDGLGLLDVP